MHKMLILTLAVLLAAASIDTFSCEYIKGEYADYLRCAVGHQNVEVVSYSTQSGATVDCIYQRQDFMPPRLKAITFTDGEDKQDDTCGHVGSFCDSCKRSCDSVMKAKQ